MAASNEAAKLQQHLDLLREQYVKLQQRHAELEQRYTQAIATSGNVGPDHFISRLLKVVADLYDKPLYSDMTVVLADRKMAGHRFVLASRSRHWNPKDELLSSTAELDLSHMTPFVAAGMMRWVYTDNIVLPSEQSAIIELLAASNKYCLNQLKEKCEQALISGVTVRNCIKLYQTSEEHSAEILKKYCLQIISSHWSNLNTSDFAELSAPLLYDMFKAHSEFPLHLAIQHLREDVVFLFLIEYNSQLPHKLDECDTEGNIPLNLALLSRHEGIANTLVSHKCDLDIQDSESNSLLHLAILRGDSFAASFLVKNGANTILARKSTQETPLHLVASYNPSQALTNVSTVAVKEAPWPSESMAPLASLLLEYHANPDSQDASGHTPLQRAIQCNSDDVFTILLSSPVLNLDLRNGNGETALWLSLKQLDSTYLTCQDTSEYEYTFASRLVKRGANADAVNTRTGNSLLHQAALESNEAAAVFLVQHGALPNHKNSQGETPIHIAAKNGLSKLVEVLLQYGADPNLQTALKPKSVRPSPIAVQATKSDDFVPSILSPSTLGALSALNVTSYASSYSAYSIESGHSTSTLATTAAGYSSTGPPFQPPPAHQPPLSLGSRSGQLLPLAEAKQVMQSRGSPMAKRSPSPRMTEYGGSNPFGAHDSDDEDEEEDVGFSSLQQGVSGYHVAPLSRGSMDALVPGRDLMQPWGLSSLNAAVTPSPPFSSLSSQLEPPPPSGSDAKEFIDPPVEFDISEDPGGRSPLHLAIAHSHPSVVDVLLKHSGSGSSGKLQVDLNVNLSDGNDEIPLGLALWTEQFDVARRLLESGAAIEGVGKGQGGGGGGKEPLGLLYLAIVREKSRACLFLLEHGADFKKRSPSNKEGLLILAIRHQLEPVADRLCEMGVDLGASDQHGNSPLWVALRSRQETIATKLIIHGCDPNAWHRAPDGTSLTLLHRAILLQDTPTACFLIRSGADMNSPSRPVTVEGQFSPPLHMACQRGLREVVQCLVDHHTDVNAKDSTGCCSLHVSISCKQPRCSEILLAHPNIDLTIRDKNGQTPFATALAVKDNEAGLAILKRDPKAAEQVDSRGQNFLHLAVLREDVEAVIFLLSVRAHVNSKAQNSTLTTPLHYAIKGGSEILVRHLLLAGAHVTDVDNHQRGVLHMAVEGDFSTILSVLLENGADPDQMDDDGNGALHLAMQLGHMNCVRVLLEESNLNMGSINMRGQNCLHVLAKHAKENAAAIFSLLIEAAPSFPINKQDVDGNTPLFLAYFGGSTVLCDALIQAGAHPGVPNKQGLSIFNSPVATKQLLFRILNQISTEPTWLEGNFCMNCNMKFNISHRKHHCRHCGRLLCKQCTNHQMPILKFELAKPVRVCEVCADSFILGDHAS